ncbi:MAG: prepilin-type N-terminal cleavage/methylation domain-containing protein [Acidimicrobiales bacterium]
MISTYQRLKRRRDAGEIDGFTLIELLIVIVVLGILAAVVIFALGGITGKSAVAACQADGATVATALSAFNAQNPSGLAALGVSAEEAALLPGAAASYSGPYISSWPANGTHYAFALFGGVLGIEFPDVGSTAWVPTVAFTAPATVTTLAPYAGPSGAIYEGPLSCTAVT